MLFIRYFIAIAVLMLSFDSVYAHQLRPSIVTIQFSTQGEVGINIQTNIERIVAGIGIQHTNTQDAPQAQRYNALRKLPPEQLKQEFMRMFPAWLDSLSLNFNGEKSQLELEAIHIPEVGDIERARLSNISLKTQTPINAETVTWHFPEKYGNNVVHFVYADKPKQKTSYWLTKNAVSPVFKLQAKYIPKTWAQIAKEYTELGYVHIMPAGLDHILFVLGLFLLSVRMKPLLWQVTAFTLAHSITLSLTVFGLINFPDSIINPLVALSIAYVGIENIFTKKLHSWRVVIVFLFGLLHGMGFAQVLTGLGLPDSDLITALIFFNVGVELGQLSVIVLAFIAVV